MELLLLLKALAIGFFISLPITPIGILCLKRMFSRGPLIGFISGLGSATADFIFSIIAAFGVSFITSQLDAHPLLIQLISGIVLIIIGIYILATPPSHIKSDLKKGENYSQAYLSACALTLSNPASILTFAGIFTAIGISPEEAHAQTAFLVAFSVFLGAMLWWTISSVIMSFIHKQISARTLERINTICGLLVCLFGILALLNLVYAMIYGTNII
ncbi:MAG: LysE family translocator [Candidatus Babeliales bacterium]